MARDSGLGGFIGSVIFVVVIANAVSDGFKLNFWFVLGITVALLYGLPLAVVFGAGSVTAAVKKGKRCTHWH